MATAHRTGSRSRALCVDDRVTAISFFGAPLPALVGVNEAFAERTEELHETLATAGYFLIGLHALAALFHHYVQRDNTLKRMSF
jgi:cytochrome b561